jgi:hypothetical protein
MQVLIMIFGSKDPHYFNYEGPDGFKSIRYVLINIELIIFRVT